MEQPDSDWRLDPERMPQKLQINLPGELLAVLQQKAALTGRSIDEIILEMLDRELQADR
ncbi:MAG: hypothetical protein RLZZ54_1447 [Cyanobacteriota bacterium]|jgi:hypothetical protein